MKPAPRLSQSQARAVRTPPGQDPGAVAAAVDRLGDLVGAMQSWTELGMSIRQQIRLTIEEIKRAGGLGSDSLPYVEAEKISKALESRAFMDVDQLLRRFRESKAIKGRTGWLKS